MTPEPGRALPRIDCVYDSEKGWSAGCAWVDEASGDTGFLWASDYPTPRAAIEALERRLVQWGIPWDTAPPFHTVRLVIDGWAPSAQIAELRTWARQRGWVAGVDDPDAG